MYRHQAVTKQMKVLSQDRSDGYMQLEVESDTDLWHLRHVIGPGDTLRMDDQRTTIEGGEKKHCTLTLEVEKTDYQRGRLRATGEITAAPEDVEHGYHTFNLEPGVTVEVWKEEWHDHELDRVEEAAETEEYTVLVCTVDKERAHLAVVTETGIDDVAALDSDVSGKMYRDRASSPDAFRKELAGVLAEHGEVDHLILAGPGFEKEEVYAVLEDEHPAVADAVTLVDVSTVGMAGVQEVLKRGAVDRVLAESRVADEVAAVEELLARLQRDDGDAVYGPERVQEAVDMGAVDTLLISDTEVHEREALVERVEQQDGAVQLVHDDHDAGRQLASLGGVAALLRYRIE